MRPIGTEPNNLGGEVAQDWVDRREDGAAVPIGEEEFGHGGQDENVGLGPNLVQGLVKAHQSWTIDDLCSLHTLPRRDVHTDHVAANVSITDHGEKSANRHFSELKTNSQKYLAFRCRRKRRVTWLTLDRCAYLNQGLQTKGINKTCLKQSKSEPKPSEINKLYTNRLVKLS